MTVMTQTGDAWTGALESFRGGRGATAPAWLRGFREASWQRFGELGFPALTHEEWRFTDVGPIAKGAFALADGSPALPSPEALEPFHFEGLSGSRLVFVDGRFAPSLSQVVALPPGAVVSSLGEALRAHEALVREHLGRLTDDQEAFTALNGAFAEDGVFVSVPDGVELAEPVTALFVSSTAATMAHPRSLVLVGSNASATVIEDYVSLDDEETSFANPVTEITVGDGGRARHYLLERGNVRSFGVSSLYVDQGRDTDFASHSALLGGALVRNNVFPRLSGPGAFSVVNGMYLPRGTQHHDNRMCVRHAQPHCESRQYYRGILDDDARAMFSGRIVVDEDAQRTDAVQSNKNLLLSDRALVETRPQLEIYADDVKCTHGATIGQIDDEAVFYCRARGIPERTARRLLVFAFVNEIFERMEIGPVRERLQAMVAERLRERKE